MLKSSNPALRGDALSGAGTYGATATMTLVGTAHKTLMLLSLVFIAAAFVWGRIVTSGEPGTFNPQPAMPWMWGGMIGGLVLALVTIFNPKVAPFTAPIYALCEGLFLGAISCLYAQQYQGLVLQAVILTFGVFFVMLALYGTRVIQPTQKLAAFLGAAMGAILLLYLATIVLGMFGTTIPYIHGSGPIGIGFSLFVVGIAALCLIMDFGMIEAGAAAGAPKRMEWYAAFSLLVTLVWLYLEILRLLAKLQSRD